MSKVCFREEMSETVIEETSPEHVDSDHDWEENAVVIPRGKAYSVNSRRVSVGLLQLLARMLGLPERASLDELRQLIEGQLAEIGKDSRNVQIIVEETETDMTVSLVDATGVFQHITITNSTEDVDPEEDLSLKFTDVCAERDALQQELRIAKADLQDSNSRLEDVIQEIRLLQRKLEEERSSGEPEATSMKLQEALRREKESRQQLWNVSCQQVRDFDEVLDEKDEVIRAKDQEIAVLKEQLSRRDLPTHVGSGSMDGEA